MHANYIAIQNRLTDSNSRGVDTLDLYAKLIICKSIVDNPLETF